EKPALHTRPTAAAQDEPIHARVAFALGRILEKAINILERAILNREISKRRAYSKRAVANVAEVEMRELQMARAAQKPERFRTLIVGAPIAAQHRGQSLARHTVDPAHAHFEALAAAVSQLDR